MIGYKFIATDCSILILRFSDRCLTLYFGCGIVIELYLHRTHSTTRIPTVFLKGVHYSAFDKANSSVTLGYYRLDYKVTNNT
jgi:hypothetical protein